MMAWAFVSRPFSRTGNRRGAPPQPAELTARLYSPLRMLFNLKAAAVQNARCAKHLGHCMKRGLNCAPAEGIRWGRCFVCGAVRRPHVANLGRAGCGHPHRTLIVERTRSVWSARPRGCSSGYRSMKHRLTPVLVCAILARPQPS
jgi:hypothetical protein